MPTPNYTIIEARPEDLSQLSAIELAAARLLEGHAPEPVLNETTSLDVLKRARRDGRLWVAVAGDAPVGFAHVEVIEAGLGARLVLRACEWAAVHKYGSVTLTTFRDLP